jgi:alpha-beta hydrolase superfamily lysophospholipase
MLNLNAWLARGEIPFDETLPIHIVRGKTARFYEPNEYKGAIVVLHGIQSHSGWFTRSCSMLANAGYYVIAPDRRGSGGYMECRGHFDSYRELLDDIDAIVLYLKRYMQWLPVYLMGISWGAKLALFYEAMRPGIVDGLILSTPGIRAKTDLTLIDKVRIGVALALGRGRKSYLPIPIDIPQLFTDDPHLQEWIRLDPSTLRACTARAYLESKKIDILLKRKIKNCRSPVLLLLAGRDDITDNNRTADFLTRHYPSKGPDAVQTIVYPSARHTLDFEAEWKHPVMDILNVLNLWKSARSENAA